MIAQNSYLSDTEYYNLHGSLDSSRIENLLSLSDKMDGADSVHTIGVYADDAAAQYPAEDFASDIKSRLQSLHSNLRGANRETLAGIMESLDDLLQCQFYATEEGLDNIKKIQKIVSNCLN